MLYSMAKRVQLVDKDLDTAIQLFREAINVGDRVDSALKDMASILKQQHRPEEAIDAIQSLRNRCSFQSQESIDNILLDLYQSCGRVDDQIALLEHKLQLISQGIAFNGKRTKTGHSERKKIVVTIEKEKSRLLANLGRELMRKGNYREAEAVYRRSITEVDEDNIKLCNLGYCLMMQGRILEGRIFFNKMCPAGSCHKQKGEDSQLRAFAFAQEMICYMESNYLGGDGGSRNSLVNAFSGRLYFCQPPCIEFSGHSEKRFADQNSNPVCMFSTQNENVGSCNQLLNIGVSAQKMSSDNVDVTPGASEREVKMGEKKMSFIVGTVDVPLLKDQIPKSVIPQKKMANRLKVFEDITPSGDIP